MMSGEAVVPGYYLVGYNQPFLAICGTLAVVPGYYLVCYNSQPPNNETIKAVVPGYYLVCYNSGLDILEMD